MKNELILQDTKNENPWENGEYDNYDFKAFMDSLDFKITN